MPAPTGSSTPAIRTLLLCDLVASTRLVERVGDAAAAELLARHDRAARDLLSLFGGREIDKSDGFLLMFDRPIEAVRFALAYRAELRELGAAYDSEVTSRVGIHLGEVMLRENLGWLLRTMGRVREALDETERAYRLDALDPMTANLTALARMAAGRVAEAVPVYEDLVERMPDMSFPVSSLLRAYAFQEDWGAVDRLLELAARRQLREFEEGLPFIRAKRDPTPGNIGAWRSALAAHVERTGCVDASRLVYAAHLGLVDEAYHAAQTAHLGPAGAPDDTMGPDGYRTSLMFQAGMPELRDDPRFVPLCARLGLVEFWTSTGKWPDCADEVPYDFRGECAKARRVPAEASGLRGP